MNHVKTCCFRTYGGGISSHLFIGLSMSILPARQPSFIRPKAETDVVSGINEARCVERFQHYAVRQEVSGRLPADQKSGRPRAVPHVWPVWASCARKPAAASIARRPFCSSFVCVSKNSD